MASQSDYEMVEQPIVELQQPLVFLDDVETDQVEALPKKHPLRLLHSLIGTSTPLSIPALSSFLLFGSQAADQSVPVL